MNDLPATRLHDVVVVQEQSRATWAPGQARIRDGRIVVPAAGAPDEFFAHPSATYRIDAVDGGNRIRRFPNLVLVARSGAEYVFD